jgi:hypothetical protein
LPPDSLESVYNPHTSSHGLAGVELTKLPLNALTSNQSNCNARAMRANRVAIAIQLDRFVSAAKRIRRDGLPLKANLFV